MSASLRWNEIKAGMTVYHVSVSNGVVLVIKLVVASCAQPYKQQRISVGFFDYPKKNAFIKNIHALPNIGDVKMSEPSRYYYRTKRKAEAFSAQLSPEGIKKSVDILQELYSILKITAADYDANTPAAQALENILDELQKD